MATTIQLGKRSTFTGLNTWTFTVPAQGASPPSGGAGVYQVTVMPTANSNIQGDGAGANSSPSAPVLTSSTLSIVINQNGTPVYTSTAFKPTQTVSPIIQNILCAVSDVITVVLTSSSPIDNQLNTIKTYINITKSF